MQIATANELGPTQVKRDVVSRRGGIAWIHAFDGTSTYLTVPEWFGDRVIFDVYLPEIPGGTVYLLDSRQEGVSGCIFGIKAGGELTTSGVDSIKINGKSATHISAGYSRVVLKIRSGKPITLFGCRYTFNSFFEGQIFNIQLLHDMGNSKSRFYPCIHYGNSEPTSTNVVDEWGNGSTNGTLHNVVQFDPLMQRLYERTVEGIAPNFFDSVSGNRSRWGDENQSLVGAPLTNPGLFIPKVLFESGSFYVQDGTNDTIDPVLKAAYDAEVQQVVDFRTAVITQSDRYVANPDIEANRVVFADNAYQHIEHWANGNAMMGDHPDSVGWHKTAEVISAVAISLLKIRDHREAGSTVKLWLKKLCDRLISIYKTSIMGPTTRNNNHRYWDGYAVGLAGLYLGNLRLFHWAMKGLDIGIHQVDSNGYLPLELGRGSKAYHYHLYALRALTGLAELAAPNRDYMPVGYYPYTKNNSALLRLADKVFSESQNLQNLTVFSEKTDPHRPLDFTWMELLMRRNSSVSKLPQAREMATLLKSFRQAESGFIYDSLLGGNVTLHFGKHNLDSVINQ